MQGELWPPPNLTRDSVLPLECRTKAFFPLISTWPSGYVFSQSISPTQGLRIPLVALPAYLSPRARVSRPCQPFRKCLNMLRMRFALLASYEGGWYERTRGVLFYVVFSTTILVLALPASFHFFVDYNNPISNSQDIDWVGKRMLVYFL